MSKRPRLNYLRAFDAAARCLSFSRAGEELHLSQAAISQQIRQLEKALGAALFIRGNRSLSLSENGKAYFLVVREVLDRLDTVTDQIFPGTEKSIVSVRCTPSIASIWLAPLLRDFHREHPEIDVRIRTIDMLPDALRPHQSELEILRNPSEGRAQGNLHKLWDAEIFPVCAPEYLRQYGPFSTPQDVIGQELIHTLGYSNDWHRWARVFGAGQVAATGLTVDGLNIALDATCRGEGIMLGRRPLMDACLEGARLVPAMQQNLSLWSAYYLRVPVRSPNLKSSRILADWLLQSLS